MKPQLQVSPELKLVRGESRRGGFAPRQLTTSYHYFKPSDNFRGRDSHRKLTTPSPSPSFPDLSNDFIGSEMKRDYLAEAVFFAIFFAASAWPIVSMFYALAGLFK